ncbi:MAG: glutathione peroxidase [Gemmataceae bacterium]|nr:glutathione peroxidase [Gemmataceae bacterium]
MRKCLAVLLALPIAAALSVPTHADEKGKVPAVLNFKMKGLDGKEVDLSQFQGKVVLFVNVASKCGCTPQYKALQALYEKHNKDGLVIVGVPVNDFGKQEPGSDEDIAKFCDSKYGVKFPMLSKVSTVKGGDAAPLYKFLTSKDTNPKFAGDIKWNFTKFLVGRDGEVVARFESRVEPDSAEVVKAIETELKKGAK